MTYFSDFESSEYYYNDEQLRKAVFDIAEHVYLDPPVETLPQSLFDDVDLPYFTEAKHNSWLPDINDIDWD
jgi:hypothetical protein